MMVMIVVGLAVALLVVVALLVRSHMRAISERSRFAAIVDVDAEVARLRTSAMDEVARLRAAATAELSNVKQEAERARAAVQQQMAQHDQVIAQANRARGELSQLSTELRSVEGSLEDISFGLYKPQYNFDTPEQFKKEMGRVFEQQKEMVRDGKAASFAVSWTINGNTREGERMQKQYTKLILRAFNGECDAAIAKVTWNSASKMEERIKKAFVAINKLGEVMSISLSSAYRELRLAELRLEYELAEKKKEIADEQRRIREQMKDEQRALQEAERAQADAEAEEDRFLKALDRAKVELAKARGEDHNRLSAKIRDLQSQLVDAQARSVRAKSLAEMTKAGYVYVISNIGSFGENVFKIGMTRRLEPMDRVRELGGASVPFPFDVHAMVYDDDAPGLEAAFHQRFKDRSVNLVNGRKEFFSVAISELEAFAKERKLPMTFTKLAEARDYRESVAMRLAKGSGPTIFPSSATEALAVGSTLSKFSADRASSATNSSANRSQLEG